MRFFTIPDSHYGIYFLVIVDYSSVRVSPRFYARYGHEATSSLFLQNPDCYQCGNHGCTCPPLVCVRLIVSQTRKQSSVLFESEVYPSEMQNTSEQGTIALTAISSAANLLLTIPAILITIPPLSLPSTARRSKSTISKIIIFVVTMTLSMLPRKAIFVLCDLCLILSLLSTYVLPGMSFR